MENVSMHLTIVFTKLTNLN